jgi:GntR family transcriptional regulator, phosphonate transport system regulatory protein
VDDQPPRYVQIADELEDEIHRKPYAAGQRLPSGQAIAQQYGVNRHTVERAMDRLQAKGLIYRVRGHGAYVSPGRLEYRIAETMSFTDSVSRLGLPNRQRILHLRHVEATARQAEELRVPTGATLVLLERLRLAGEVPVAVLRKYYPEARFPGLLDAFRGLRRSLPSTRALLSERYGVELYRAHSVFEVEPADTELAGPLGVAVGSPLIRIESLDICGDGTPAEWGAGFFRGDAVRVRVEVREPR